MLTSIEVTAELAAPVAAEVRQLAASVEARDAAPPLSDDAVVHLSARGGERRHVLARRVAALVGYAQVDPAGGTAEIVAGEDVGALFDPVEQQAGGRVIVWSHGRRSPVGPAAEQRGYRRVRELWQLRRSLSALQDVPLPGGVRLRAFRPGQDEDAWLAVNAAAFASHPEQGRWQRADLEARKAESWFDPAGLLLAEDDASGELLGFHWTKTHPGQLGEVYVLAVAPAAQGRRLGAALLAAGLAFLAARGCTDVLLYVDGDNTPAMRLYERDGFTRFDLDAQFAHPA